MNDENNVEDKAGKINKILLYGIMVMGLLNPVAIYCFGLAAFHYFVLGETKNILLSGLFLMLCVFFTMLFYVADIIRIGSITGKILGAVVLFLVYKPAYPLYRQCLLEEKTTLSLIYFFVSGILTALAQVGVVMLFYTKGM